jgi:hypothetical protein
VFTVGLSADRDARDRVRAIAARCAKGPSQALGTGWAAGLGFRQVEVVARAAGGPRCGCTARRRASGLPGVTRTT